ncbi:hypothetical protein LCGC14_0382550 [marine sediment metagenome]|uniref:Uncharacterized protein n=1 Tax=marine sediment metagenome TaxID=412755 RepID=A0A0F9VP44_9ZZZZ
MGVQGVSPLPRNRSAAMTKWRIAHNVMFILFLFLAPGILIEVIL